MKYARAKFLAIMEDSINTCLGAASEGKRTLDVPPSQLSVEIDGYYRLNNEKIESTPYATIIRAFQFSRVGKMDLQML